MIVYRNNRLYNNQTQTKLQFVKTIAENVGGIRMISYLYEDCQTKERFRFTNQQLEELKRLGS